MSDTPRRRLRYQVAMSLDGFIAAKDGSYDWIPMDPDIDFASLFAQFDTLVMGRKTYEVMQAYPDGINDHGVYGKRTIVFSRTLVPAEHPNVTILAGDVERIVADLKAEPGDKDVWLFGGGDLFRQLANAGLVDSVELAVIPILLGDGIPGLPPGDRVKLELTGHRIYPGTSTVMLEYRVVRE